MRALSFFLEGKTLKTALVRKEKNTIAIEHLQMISLDDPHVKPLYILTSSLVAGYDLITSSLSSSDALFRKLSLPLKDQKKALGTLPFQIEQLIPYPLEEAILAPILRKESPQSTAATVFAVRESTLQEHLNFYENLGIDPEVISCAQLNLYHLFCWLYPEQKNGNVFYAGEEKSFCICISQGEIAFSHTLHFNLENLDEAKKELERFAIYLKNKNPELNQAPWILLGQKASYVKQIWSEAVSDSFQLFPEEKSDLDTYALSIGAALNALSRQAYSLNFREGKWEALSLKLKRKKMAIQAVAVSLTLSLVLAIGSHLLLAKKQSFLASELKSYLPASLAKDEPHSVEELSIKLWEWEKSLSSQKLAFPFAPNLPTVSDVLAWLSSHPSLVASDGKKEEIEIKSLRYQIYKYPKLGEGGGAYQGKLELELTAPTSRIAREFHDALLKGDRIVNSKKEIKWSNQNNSYFVSFELNTQKKGSSS